jgi:hypothetical protein
VDIFDAFLKIFFFIVCVQSKKIKKRENVQQKNPEEKVWQILLNMAENRGTKSTHAIPSTYTVLFNSSVTHWNEQRPGERGDPRLIISHVTSVYFSIALSLFRRGGECIRKIRLSGIRPSTLFRALDWMLKTP